MAGKHKTLPGKVGRRACGVGSENGAPFDTLPSPCEEEREILTGIPGVCREITKK